MSRSTLLRCLGTKKEAVAAFDAHGDQAAGGAQGQPAGAATRRITSRQNAPTPFGSSMNSDEVRFHALRQVVRTRTPRW